MNISGLKADINKAISMWNLNTAAINELVSMNELYLNHYEKFNSYNVAEADVAAFVTWVEEMQNGLATGFIKTSAIAFYPSIVVNRLSRKPQKAVAFADAMASRLGMSTNGIAKALGSSTTKKIKETRQVFRDCTPRETVVYKPNPYAGCTGGSISSTRC